jgi:hypothetical protein
MIYGLWSQQILLVLPTQNFNIMPTTCHNWFWLVWNIKKIFTENHSLEMIYLTSNVTGTWNDKSYFIYLKFWKQSPEATVPFKLKYLIVLQYNIHGIGRNKLVTNGMNSTKKMLKLLSIFELKLCRNNLLMVCK